MEKYIMCQNCNSLFKIPLDYVVVKSFFKGYICPFCRHLNYGDTVKGELKFYEVDENEITDL